MPTPLFYFLSAPRVPLFCPLPLFEYLFTPGPLFNFFCMFKDCRETITNKRKNKTLKLKTHYLSEWGPRPPPHTPYFKYAYVIVTCPKFGLPALNS